MRPDLKLKDRVPFYTKQIKKVLKVQSVKLSKKSAELKKLDLVELAKKLLALAIQKSEKIEILEHSKILEWMQLQVLELDKNEKLFEKQNRVILKLNEHLDDICRILRKERKEIPVKVVANDTRDSESESEQVILDQEWDSGDDQELEKPVERKKNRRGQQARRAIWEKKYGEKAKHIVQGKVKPKEPKVKEEKLHPSWEAKKSQQAIVPATGKKIVFEDDVKEELHPSWVAKKQAKEQAAAKLASVKPTKITFNDE